MSRLGLMAVALGCWTGIAATQAVSADLTADQKAKIDAVFESYGPTTPGCAMGVMREGNLAYARGYGMADLERKVPITPATVFDVGSTSKQFTAAALLLLAQDGKLSLSDDVRKYVPELPDFGTPVTIDQLLQHTSGWRDYVGLMSLSGIELDEIGTDAQALAVLSRQRQLNFPSGTRHEYSNTGYFLASVIVQRASGQSLAKFSAERIFQPLGMTSTLIRADHAMLIPGRALGYAPDENGGFKLSMSNWEQTGDGAVQISIEDIARWDRNFYEPRVGGARFVEQLQEPGKLNNGEAIQYGRGLFVDEYRGLRRVHHGGAWIGYRAMLERFPEQRTSVAVFCNSDAMDPAGLSHRIIDVVLADVLDRPAKVAAEQAPAKPGKNARPVEAARFVGGYFVAESDTVFNVVEAEGALALKFSDVTLPLTQTGPATFAVTGYPATVDFAIKGKSLAHELTLRIDGRAETPAVRFTPEAPAAADLQAYVGTFYSPELDVTWPIVVHEGRLTIETPTRKFTTDPTPLDPAMRDAFSAPKGFMRFVRDASGRVIGFDLSASRMRGIHFEARP